MNEPDSAEQLHSKDHRLDHGTDPSKHRAPSGQAALGSRADRILTAVLALVTLAYLLRASTFSPEARLLPVATSLPALFLLLVLFTRMRRLDRRATVAAPLRQPQAIVASDDQFAVEAELEKADRINERWSITWVALAMVVPLTFGFMLGFPLFLLAYLRFQSRETYLFSIIYTSLFAVFAYFFFIVWIELRPYEGLLDLPGRLNW